MWVTLTTFNLLVAFVGSIFKTKFHPIQGMRATQSRGLLNKFCQMVLKRGSVDYEDKENR